MEKKSMTKKYTLLFLSLSLFLCSCIKEDPLIISDYTIRNTSNHNVAISRNIGSDGEIEAIILLAKGQEWKYYSSDEAGEMFPFDKYQILIITYSDTVSIIHGNDLNSEAKRSIIIKNSWNEGGGSENHHRYSYRISDEDYKEALEKQ